MEQEVPAGTPTPGTALKAEAARGSFAARSPAPVLQLAVAMPGTQSAATYIAGVSHSLSFTSSALHGAGVCASLALWKAASRGRPCRCIRSTLTPAASEAAVAEDTVANAVAAEITLGAAARGASKAAATMKRGRDPSKIVTSRSTRLASGNQRATVTQPRDRGTAGTSADEQEMEEVQSQVLENDFDFAAIADASEKRQDLISPCGVPVGSLAAFQEYARRLSLWRRTDVDVATSSTSQAAGYQENKKDTQRQEEIYRKKQTREQQHSHGTAEEGVEQRKRLIQPRREQNNIELDQHHLNWAQQPHEQQQQPQEREQHLRRRRVVVLGSTGSIGRSTLQVVEAFPDRFQIVGLAAAGTKLPLLLQQIQRHRPQYVAVGNAAAAAALRKLLLSRVSLPDADAAPASTPAIPDVHTSAHFSTAAAAPSSRFAAASPATATSISPASPHSFHAAAPAAESPAVDSEHSIPQILYGTGGLVELAGLDVYDVLVSAIVGFTGLQPTLKALTTGKDVALANKETLVAAGDIFRNLYKMSSRCIDRGRHQRQCERTQRTHTYSSTLLSEKVCSGGGPAAAGEASGTTRGTPFSPLYPPCSSTAGAHQQQKPLGMLLPVDSEHSAIFQALQGVAPMNYPPRKLLLVATGGPFRGRKKTDLQLVTLDQVLKHPRWSMGAKISVDSATLMNKGLEVIEAHYAFGCPYSAVEVLVHPQAVVHSAVELCDGAILAQLGAADMKLPIAYALTWPERLSTSWPRVDLLKEGVLTFEKPDCDTFGCLRLAYEAGVQGGLAPACLNAANEVAVKRLLEGKLSFLQIEEVVRHVLREYDRHDGSRPAFDALTLQDVLEADSWARRVAEEWKK